MSTHISPIPDPAGGSSVGASPLKEAFSSLWKRPEFIVIFSILLASALGISFATASLQLHFRKQPVSLQRSISQLPKDMGPWRQVSVDMPLSPDIQAVLGTDKYIFRDYVDTRIVPASRLAEFEGKDYAERRALLARVQSDYPAGVIFLSVTYYTGMVDTVAHIPDRCFVADGYVPTDQNYQKWPIAGCPVDEQGWALDASGRRTNDVTDTGTGASDAGLPVRFINFEDQDTRTRKLTRNVTYFFEVNGRWEANPIGVRTSLQDLFQKHGYYAKVELMTLLTDVNRSAKVKQDFLASALPELDKSFPDWAAVVSGRAPAASATTTPSGSGPTTAPTP